jgi:monoamine oxidase
MILGGGIEGLYTAHQLLKHNPDRNLILLEREQWGGRIFTYSDKFMTVEAGAGRFSSDHKLLLELLKEFHLNKKIVPITSDKEYAENSDFNLKVVIGKIVAFSKIDFLHNLTKLSLLDYAKMVVSKEEAQFLEDSFGYYTELVDMNAKDAIHLLNQLNGDFFVLNGGLSQLIDALIQRIQLCPNVVMKKEEVLAIHRQNNQYIIHTNKCKYATDLCICTFQHDVLRQLCTPLAPLLKYIVGAPLCRIYCAYDRPWFKDLPKLTTKSPLRMVIPYSKTVVMFYMDNKYAMFWNDIYHKHGIRGVNKTIKYYVKEVLDIDMPTPKKTNVFYWEKGVGYWTIGADSKHIAKQLQNPFPNFYVCGENYSANYQQWIEGALETSQQVCDRLD